MKIGEEIKVEIEQGKMLVIKLVHIGEANADGIRTVSSNSTVCPGKSISKTEMSKLPISAAKKLIKPIRVRSALLYQVPLLKYWWKKDKQ